MLRRALVLGGFAVAAWLVGSAPANAEALGEQVGQVAGTVSEAGAVAADAGGVGTEAAQAAEAVTTTVRDAGSGAEPTVPAPPGNSPDPSDISGVVEQARQQTENAVAAVTGTGHLDFPGPEAAASGAPAPEEPETPAQEAAESADRDPAADREPIRRAPAASPAAGAPREFHAPQRAAAPERLGEFADATAVDSDARGTMAVGSAQPQFGGSVAMFAGYLARLPETARPLASSPAGRHALAMVPQNPVDEPSFSPD
ncbi:hypothetical protein [Marinitenerispora sediminis]|uniref:hypothetical protein n=1 Tax=Marinitenerispora sediminis TaxID=1931232 RepID=UPI0011C01C61|nr:hypothetical protein [Marinitenerispora sediminis]